MTGGVALELWMARLRGIDDIESPVVVACSGGADSLALLALACALGFDVVAVYVDHGLRPGTEREFGVVQRVAAQVGARSTRRAVHVGSGPNLEARAREARYAALDAARAEVRASAVLVGHTIDDQAETVLLNLLRGSGTTGLAGMPARRGSVRRPLLGLRRRDTREICARLGFVPVDDPMNADAAHRRVWIRREVLPFLEAGAHRDVIVVLARQAEVVRADDELLDQMALAAVPITDASLTVDALMRAPLPLARRAVRLWLGTPPPPQAQVDRVLDVCRGDRRAVDISGGRRVERVRGRIHVVEVAEPSEPITFSVPGPVEFGRFHVDSWIERGGPVRWPDGHTTAVADADRVGASASVRAARPGERFRPAGATGSKLVHDALADAGVPASARANWPVVTDTMGEIVWVVGYRIDERVRVTSCTRRFLWLTTDRQPRGNEDAT